MAGSLHCDRSQKAQTWWKHQSTSESSLHREIPKKGVSSFCFFTVWLSLENGERATGPFHGSKALPVFEAQSFEFHLLILEGGQEGRDGSWLNRARAVLFIYNELESDLFKTRPNIMPPWKPSPSWEEEAQWMIYAGLPLYKATSRPVLTAVTLQGCRAQGKVL